MKEVNMLIPFFNADIKRGYDDTTETLFAENYNRVYKKAFFILSDVELAKDATQETFIRAFLKLDTLEDKSRFRYWVIAIAANVCKRMLKQRITYKQNNIPIYDDEGNLKSYIPELVDFNVPERIYENTEIRQKLKQCMRELDIETEQIIIMRFYAGLSIKEIAKCMIMKEGTVKSTIHRAKKKIAEKMKRFVD
ncbi:MAG: RNA polymerase sigma factor [Ruminiclostridium sp.]|nr:RNA polymerase sigma factor [Ruminiclostridium sp.]